MLVEYTNMAYTTSSCHKKKNNLSYMNHREALYCDAKIDQPLNWDNKKRFATSMRL